MTNKIKAIVSSLISICVITACNSRDTLPETDLQACEQGRSDARALCSAGYKADRELHAALLAVKSREWQLRQNGDSIAAAAYIDAFKDEVTQTDKTLASKIF